MMKIGAVYTVYPFDANIPVEDHMAVYTIVARLDDMPFPPGVTMSPQCTPHRLSVAIQLPNGLTWKWASGDQHLHIFNDTSRGLIVKYIEDNNLVGTGWAFYRLCVNHVLYLDAPPKPAKKRAATKKAKGGPNG